MMGRFPDVGQGVSSREVTNNRSIWDEGGGSESEPLTGPKAARLDPKARTNINPRVLLYQQCVSLQLTAHLNHRQSANFYHLGGHIRHKRLRLPSIVSILGYAL